MYALAVISLAVLAGQAVATPFASAGPLAALLKRQSSLDPSQIPSQCQSACTVAVNALNTCSDVNCLCTASVNTGLYNCLECALGLGSDAGLLSEAQSSLTQYEQNCAAAGVNLTPLTLTAPTGSPSTPSSGTPTTAAGSNPSVTASNPAGTVTVPAGTANTVPAGTVNTAAASTNTAASSGSNPLGHNSAGMVGVSVASVAGAVGVAMAALL